MRQRIGKKRREKIKIKNMHFDIRASHRLLLLLLFILAVVSVFSSLFVKSMCTSAYTYRMHRSCEHNVPYNAMSVSF